MSNLKSYARHGAMTLKNEGVVPLLIKSLQKVQKTKAEKSPRRADKIHYTSLVARSDVMAADWSKPTKQSITKKKVTKTINWVMSPPSGGGGHQNIFRFIEYLDSQGYKNNVYLYSTFDPMTIAQAKENVKAYCNARNISFYRYKGKMLPADVVFATGWETAYPVFNDKIDAQKIYFVQDFEPYFYPMGTDYILAENTYRFGFHGITAGKWLSTKLQAEYGMKCDSYDFGADTNLYEFTNHGPRKDIFFYARPVTERRGFDLGIMALEVFHELLPDCTIHLAGWDVSGYDVPFEYVNHKAMKLEELSDLYNECAAALVISLTNMSLLPLELLACGTIPVVNDGPNNRLVSDNPNIMYVEPSPGALAQALVTAVTREDAVQQAELATNSIKGANWNNACKKLEAVIKRETV